MKAFYSILVSVVVIAGSTFALAGDPGDAILTDKDLIAALKRTVAKTKHPIVGGATFKKIHLTEKRKQDALMVDQCTAPKQCYKVKYTTSQDKIWECYGRTNPAKPNDFKLFLCREDKNETATREELEIHTSVQEKKTSGSSSQGSAESSGHSEGGAEQAY